MGQDSTQTQKNDPSQYKVIELAQKEGLRNVPLHKLPLFIWQSFNCRKTEKGKQMLKSLEKKQIDEDFESTKSFRGWTVTCASATALAVTMFYLEYIFLQK